MIDQLPATDALPSSSRRAARRSWNAKFKDAFRGIKLGMRGHSSFSVHFFAAATAIATCLALDCRLWEWVAILFCIGGVFTAELFNSAIETLFHGLDAETKSRWNGSLSIAAGAVLMASLFAATIGLLIFVNRIGELFRWWD